MTFGMIILAAGTGTRTQLDYNKVMYEFKGKSLIDYALMFLSQDTDITTKILVVHPKELGYMQKRFGDQFDRIITGGTTRQESVYEGLKLIKEAHVMVHDAARLLVIKDVMERLKSGLVSHDSVSPYLPVVDTLKRRQEGTAFETVDREGLVHIQTPQAFKTQTILKAHQNATDHNYTCDASLLKAVIDIDTLLIEGDRRHMKFTTQDDLPLMELIVNDTYWK